MKLIIENLKKSYEKNLVLDEIDYEFESGKIYGLLGRNGAGKTTLFNCINEDISVDNGKIYLDSEYGKNIINTNDIGYVVSTPVVPEFLTGREFLKFYLDINPDDDSMIQLFNDYRRKANKLKEEYESKYGPICTSSDMMDNSPFPWLINSFPWEGGNN